MVRQKKIERFQILPEDPETPETIEAETIEAETIDEPETTEAETIVEPQPATIAEDDDDEHDGFDYFSAEE